MTDVDPKTALAPSIRRVGRIRRALAVVLVGYLLALVSTATFEIRSAPFRLRDEVRSVLYGPAALARTLAHDALLEAAAFLPVGFFLAAAWPFRNRPTLLDSSALAAVGFALGVGVRVATLGPPGSAAGFSLCLAGTALGMWIGPNVARGPRGLLGIILKPMLAAVVALGVAGTTLFLVLAHRPDPLTERASGAGDTRDLLDQVREGRHNSGSEDGPRTVVLTQEDASALASCLLPGGPRRHRAAIEFREGHMIGRISARVEIPVLGARYINLRCAWCVETRNGTPLIRLLEFRIGRIPVTRSAVEALAPGLVAALRRDADLNELLAAIDSLAIRPGVMTLVIQNADFERSLARLLLGRRKEWKRSEVNALVPYLQHLRSVAERLPQRQVRLRDVLHHAFALARLRSEMRDPMAENRAAILAVAILFGDRRIEFLIEDAEAVAPPSQTSPLPVATVYGRQDAAQHFLVSAAVTLLHGRDGGETIGLLKEQLDATDRRRGFSFADLLFDRAGGRFAAAAARDGQAARRMQEQLAQPDFRIQDVVPPPHGLPEGISEEDLQSRFGGPEGAAFRQLEWEITQRLERCRALQ